MDLDLSDPPATSIPSRLKSGNTQDAALFLSAKRSLTKTFYQRGGILADDIVVISSFRMAKQPPLFLRAELITIGPMA